MDNTNLGNSRVRDCPVCGAKQLQSVLGALAVTSKLSTPTPESFTLTLCKNCELIYLDPLADRSVFNELYIKNGQFCNHYDYTGIRAESTMRFFQDRIRALLRTTAPSGRNVKLLEVGAGLSWLSRAAKALNRRHATVAQDITHEAVEICKNWVDYYIVGELAMELDQIRKFAPYHIISLTHVIEHLPDPVRTLAICNNLLRRDGVIFITSPHRPKGWTNPYPIESWSTWSYNHVPAHLQYFSRKSMETCADKAMLNVTFFDASSEEGQALEAWLRRKS